MGSGQLRIHSHSHLHITQLVGQKREEWGGGGGGTATIRVIFLELYSGVRVAKSGIQYFGRPKS